MKKDSASNKVSLSDFGNPPFNVRIPSKMLRIHSSSNAPIRQNKTHGDVANKHNHAFIAAPLVTNIEKKNEGTK